jgi:hypothetical protein
MSLWLKIKCRLGFHQWIYEIRYMENNRQPLKLKNPECWDCGRKKKKRKAGLPFMENTLKRLEGGE